MAAGGSLYKLLTDIAHVVYGILTIFAATYLHAVAAVIMFATFVIYQLDEQWHIEDESYEDIREYAIGLGIGATLALALRVITT